MFATVSTSQFVWKHGKHGGCTQWPVAQVLWTGVAATVVVVVPTDAYQGTMWWTPSWRKDKQNWVENK